MNDILKDGELVESDTKVAEKGLVDEKNDTLLRERLDNFLKVCFPTSYSRLFDWQKDAILKMYKWMKDHPDDSIIFARGFNRNSHYYILATLFRSMYDVDETLL